MVGPWCSISFGTDELWESWIKVELKVCPLPVQLEELMVAG